jgi:recombinational DNA repair protein RecT
MAETKKNQTAEEFFAITTTGRKGVEDMLDKMGPEIMAVAAGNVRESDAFETWKLRALVEVSTNEALIKYNVLGTRPGLFSVYQALAKSANMGLQFGGHFPQAYLVPKEGKAVLIVSEEGLAFIGTYGPGAVLRVKPELHEVYEKDRFSIDDAARTYQHEFAPFAARGKLVGYFTVLEYKDGRKQIPYILQAKVRQIEAQYGGEKNQAYEKAPEQMDRKTAMKAMLRPVAKESEGLAMAYSLEEGEPVPEMRDVTDRTTSRLKEATDALGPEHATPPEATKPLDVKPEETAAGALPASETPDETPKAPKSATPAPAATAEAPGPDKGGLF